MQNLYWHSSLCITVIRLHGLPYEFVSDRDGRFTSQFMHEACRLPNIKQAMSTAYHPQSDGQTERANKMLQQFVIPFHNDWYEHLDNTQYRVWRLPSDRNSRGEVRRQFMTSSFTLKAQ